VQRGKPSSAGEIEEAGCISSGCPKALARYVHMVVTKRGGQKGKGRIP